MFCFSPDLSGAGTFELQNLKSSWEENDTDVAQKETIKPIETESTASSFHSNVDDDEFQNMNIKVQMLGLMNGLTMVTNKREAKRITSKKSQILGEDPIFAVVTGFNEVPSKRAIVATHLPSLEVELQSSSSTGNKHHLMAVWPADFDPTGNQTSTVTFTRKMKRTPIDSLSGVQKFKSKTCMYTTENLILAISLRKGSEIITLGTTMIHFTGEENALTQTNLPVKTTKHSVKKAVAQMTGKKRSTKQKNQDKKMRRLLDPVSFKSDPSRSYYLDEDSVISMLIQSKKEKKAWPEEENISSGNEVIIENVDAFLNAEEATEQKETNEEKKKAKFQELAPVITQEGILLDLAVADEIARREIPSSFELDRTRWSDDLLSIPTKSADSDDTPTAAPMKEITVTTPRHASPKRSLSRSLHVDITHPTSSSSDLYVTSPHASSTTSDYLFSTRTGTNIKATQMSRRMSTKKTEQKKAELPPNNSNIFTWMPSPKVDETDKKCSSTRSANMISWMPTPKDFIESFNFANFNW